MRQDGQVSRWYREPMVWLVLALPLAVVVAGFVTLGISIRAGGNDDTWPTRVERMGANIQTQDLGADRAAIALGLSGQLQINAETGAVAVRLQGVSPEVRQIRLDLIHPANAARDIGLELVRGGSDFLGRLDVEAMKTQAWTVQVAAMDGAWRIVGRLKPEHLDAALAPVFVPER